MHEEAHGVRHLIEGPSGRGRVVEEMRHENHPDRDRPYSVEFSYVLPGEGGGSRWWFRKLHARALRPVAGNSLHARRAQGHARFARECAVW